MKAHPFFSSFLSVRNVYEVAYRLIGFLVSQIPHVQECRAGDVCQFLPVNPVCVIRRLVVIRMGIRVIPNDGNILQSKRPVVAASYGAVPSPVVRFQFQIISGDGIFQPLTEHRMRLGIEINHVFGLLRFVITPYHVEVQVSFDLVYERT